MCMRQRRLMPIKSWFVRRATILPAVNATNFVNSLKLFDANATHISDVNDVKLYGYVISKPDTQEKVTTLQVATEVFDPYVS